jgi:hypothetical protein
MSEFRPQTRRIPRFRALPPAKCPNDARCLNATPLPQNSSAWSPGVIRTFCRGKGAPRGSFRHALVQLLKPLPNPPTNRPMSECLPQPIGIPRPRHWPPAKRPNATTICKRSPQPPRSLPSTAKVSAGIDPHSRPTSDGASNLLKLLAPAKLPRQDVRMPLIGCEISVARGLNSSAADAQSRARQTSPQLAPQAFPFFAPLRVCRTPSPAREGPCKTPLPHFPTLMPRQNVRTPESRRFAAEPGKNVEGFAYSQALRPRPGRTSEWTASPPTRRPIPPAHLSEPARQTVRMPRQAVRTPPITHCCGAHLPL